jgi:Fe-S-cluster containining protein
MSKSTKRDCLKCGLCCVSPTNSDRFCPVTAKDMRRLPEKWTAKNVYGPEPFNMLLDALGMGGRKHNEPDMCIRTRRFRCQIGPFQNSTIRKCAALDGTPGYSVQCSLYKIRPGICRTAVKKGDRVCKFLRKEMGLE